MQPLYVTLRACEILGRPDLACTVRTLYSVAGVTCIGTSLGHVSFNSIERYLAVRFSARYKAPSIHPTIVPKIIFKLLSTIPKRLQILHISDFLISSLVQPLYVTYRVYEILGRPDTVCTTRTLYKVAEKICVATPLAMSASSALRHTW